MDVQTWLAFLVASCVIAISPGSGAVLAMGHGLSYGVRKASMTIIGLQLGLLLILAIAGAGVGSLLLASAWAFAIVKVLGACYLFYLGWMQWRSARRITEGLTTDGSGSLVGVESLSVSRRLWTGFLTNATNPKGIVFMVAVLPQFLDPAKPLLLQLGILAVTMLCVDLVVMHGYAASASLLRRWLHSAQALRAQNRIFGAVLMVMGLGLLMVRRQSEAVV